MRSLTAAGRVGILGGTLDPIHVGHVEIARAARRALALDAVVIMPARVPPHRPLGPSASPFHRFAMAALAVADVEWIIVSDDELRSEGPSYTALTLERLTRQGLQPSQIFFVTGADAFAEIETWHRYPAVLDLAQFVVVSRSGLPAGSMRERLPSLGGRFSESSDKPAMTGTTSIFLLDAQTPEVSSTDVRRRLRSGESISGLVPPPVERHILRHGLYLETTTAEHAQ